MHQNTPSYEKERKENRAISCFENIVSDIAICIKNEVTFALCCNCKSGEAVNIKDCEIAVPVTITSEVDTWARLYLSHCLCVAACQSDKCEVNYQSCSMLMESLMDFTWQKLNTGVFVQRKLYYNFVLHLFSQNLFRIVSQLVMFQSKICHYEMHP